MKNILDKIIGKKEVMYRNPLMDGDLRNEPCVCNSGKKIKRCHGMKYALNEKEMSELQGHINKAMAVARGA